MSFSFSANNRLKQELSQFTKNTNQYTGGPVEDDLTHWQINLQGPNETPYQDGIFTLDIYFSGEFPFKPPKFKFLTKIYHPNIDEEGHICCTVLKQEHWKPSTRILEILSEITLLLKYPNPDDPLRTDVAQLFKNDLKSFQAKAKDCTKRFAIIE